MDDLTAFVTARLDEDEAAANEVHRPGDCGCVDRDGSFSPDPVWCGCGYPARVLREVAAKRAILAEHGHYRVDHNWTGRTDLDAPFGCSTCHIGNDGDMYDGGWCVTVRQLAAIYSDHPGYRPEWAPEGAPDGT